MHQVLLTIEIVRRRRKRENELFRTHFTVRRQKDI
jgi:hypothetical protein